MLYKETKIGNAILTEYILENSKEINPEKVRPAVVVCPGGGYEFVSDREKEQIALKFLGNGYSAFVLTYSVAPAKYPTQLLEVSNATAYIRRNAKEYNIDKNKILVCGFSAGGHLAASLATLWDDEIITQNSDIKYGENRPNGVILAYPVITYGEKMHKGSFDSLIGGLDESLKTKMSLEKQVSKNTPPAFIWHTFNDTVVPVENSLLFATALREHNIPFELHIFPNGEHGLSLCNNITKGTNKHCEIWMDLCLKWIEEKFPLCI